MKSLIPLTAMILLAVFVLHTTTRIEVLNIRSGNYLPRKDRNPDGTFTDGKWRASQENSPREQLRNFVQTAGLLQYLLAPLLLILSIVVALKSMRPWARATGVVSGAVAVIAITLMLYREYYQSLGW